jgi:two-component system response regulator (stage 0 sporulation protein F)
MSHNKGNTQVAKRKGPSKLRPEQVEVLVIDDEHGVRSVLAEALTADGYLVYLADGTNAVEALTARNYHMIVSDLRMSVMNGLQTLALAKEKSPEAKLIVITGYPSEDSLQLCRELGVARYLVKPFSISEIRQVARNVLRRKSPIVR